MLKYCVVVVVMGGWLACSKPNPAFCCLTEADCAAAGASGGVRLCADGLSCVANQCVAETCTIDGCQAAVPVCNVATDQCEGCTVDGDCSGFAGANACDVGSGACVGCVDSGDCAGATPVCDIAGHACRGCALDTECDSGACGDDGACVPEDQIVYLDPGGDDAGQCTRTAPCKTIRGGVMHTSPAREHVVLATAHYPDRAVINRTTTPAGSVYLHGHGSTLGNPPPDAVFIQSSGIPTILRDLVFDTAGPIPISLGPAAGRNVIERVTIRNSGGVDVDGNSTIRDMTYLGRSDGGRAIGFSGSVTIERLRIDTCGSGLVGSDASVIDATNVQISNCTFIGIDVSKSSGAVRFATIANSGQDSGAGPRAFACSPNVLVESSIIWAPGISPRVPIDTCAGLNLTIVGPTPVPGALNLDPLFIDAPNHDYHLAPNSPAIDLADSGPSTDLDKESRPSGRQFDIGADELH